MSAKQCTVDCFISVLFTSMIKYYQPYFKYRIRRTKKELLQSHELPLTIWNHNTNRNSYENKTFYFN